MNYEHFSEPVIVHSIVHCLPAVSSCLPICLSVKTYVAHKNHVRKLVAFYGM